MSFLDFTEFEKQAKKNKNFIITENISSDLDTTISLMLKLKKISSYRFLLESAENNNNKGRYSAIGLLPDLIWKLENNKITLKKNKKAIETLDANLVNIKTSLENFQTISKFPENKNLPPICSGLFGYMSYDMVKYFENIKPHKKDEINIPEAEFIRPQILIVIDNLKDEIVLNIPVWSENKNLKILYREKKQIFTKIIKALNTPLRRKIFYKKENKKPIKFTSNFSEKQYENLVKKAKKYIKDGDIFQVLPSRRFYAKYPYEGIELYRVLRSLNPSPFLFYLHFNNFEIIGSSPEIMVKVNQEVVTIRPLAGTRKRGKDEIEDAKLAKDLLSDKKELAEHLMLIDLGRNDVGRVAKKNSVKVTKYMEIEFYSHVMHISSNIDGKLSKNKTCLDALIAGFPPGTVTGAPKIRAMEIISEMEPLARSFYSGSVGYFSLHQNYMDMAIMLRTCLLKNETLYVQSGAGIVHDSIPKSEFQETENKARVIFKAAKS